MASRLQENLHSVGVVVSIAFAFFGFYYEHLRTSEAVDALFSDSSVKTDNMSKLEGMTVDLVFINKGDSSITVSDLWFEFDGGASTCCIRKAAIKADENRLTAPILLPPMQAPKVTLPYVST
ncbi:MAG: hypothetical protein ACRERE_34280 [Candidatus Entotheonellia bacterium]